MPEEKKARLVRFQSALEFSRKVLSLFLMKFLRFPAKKVLWKFPEEQGVKFRVNFPEAAEGVPDAGLTFPGTFCGSEGSQ